MGSSTLIFHQAIDSRQRCIKHSPCIENPSAIQIAVPFYAGLGRRIWQEDMGSPTIFREGQDMGSQTRYSESSRSAQVPNGAGSRPQAATAFSWAFMSRVRHAVKHLLRPLVGQPL